MPSDPATDPAAALTALRENVGRVFLGKPEVVRLAVVALLADGWGKHRSRTN